VQKNGDSESIVATAVSTKTVAELDHQYECTCIIQGVLERVVTALLRSSCKRVACGEVELYNGHARHLFAHINCFVSYNV